MTDQEAFASLPGDDVIRQPMVQWTRGVTVPAPPEAIWPWLVQAGHGRAGWYTPRWIDDIINPTLFRTRVTNRRADDRLHPEFQQLHVGDVIADGPDHAAFFRVLDVRRAHAIVYYSIRHPWRGNPFDHTDPEALTAVDHQLLDGGVHLQFTWTFVLDPETPDRTRLLVRTRANYAPKALAPFVPLAGLFDATYGVAMLRAIATRATAQMSATQPQPSHPTARQRSHTRAKHRPASSPPPILGARPRARPSDLQKACREDLSLPPPEDVGSDPVHRAGHNHRTP